MTTAPIDCTWCERSHPRSFLCAPAGQYLDAALTARRSLDMPTVEFSEPVKLPAGLQGDPDVVLSQLVVEAGTDLVGGLPRPLLIITGRDHNGRPLPRWALINTVEQMRAAAALFSQMVLEAIDAAEAGRTP